MLLFSSNYSSLVFERFFFFFLENGNRNGKRNNKPTENAIVRITRKPSIRAQWTDDIPVPFMDCTLLISLFFPQFPKFNTPTAPTAQEFHQQAPPQNFMPPGAGYSQGQQPEISSPLYQRPPPPYSASWGGANPTTAPAPAALGGYAQMPPAPVVQPPAPVVVNMLNPAPVVQPPTPVVVPVPTPAPVSQPSPVVVVAGTGLNPGMCSVCRVSINQRPVCG